MLRRPTVLLSTAALAAALLPGVAQAAESPSGAGPYEVVSAFPSDSLTVRDDSQATGRRVSLPLPNCTQQVTRCHALRLLNRLDGFDLDPRIALRFAGRVDPATAVAGVRVVEVGGSFSTGLERVVHDPATSTVYAHPVSQLSPGTTYALDFPSSSGGPSGPRTTFTTMSATTGLTAMVAQLDSGSAYREAGIPASQRGLQVEASFPADGTTLAYTADTGTGLTTSPVPNVSTSAAGTYVFGSYLAPSWLTRAGDIPQTPTGSRGPAVTGRVRLPFVAIIPAGPTPRGGWPVAIFGHGFTRSDGDLFVAAPMNAAKGLATIATDVVGHGYGPRSAWRVTRDGVTVTVPAHARGVDRNGDGAIDPTEGSSTAVEPAPLAAIGSRDGLRQTVADNASLARAIRATGRLPLDGSQVTYYGQSFGGIYGTMLAGSDRSIAAFGLNVPGGPISEIARLSPAFRPLTSQSLSLSVPSLLNGGVGGFTESLPLAGQPPVRHPAPGALAIQRYLAESTWLQRPGSPETFAALVPRGRTLIQAAFGDQTVPNPTTGTLVRAGSLQDRTTLYRNDKTADSGRNPHGFLLNPTFAQGFGPGQTQMSTFLASRGRIVIDPDGAGRVFEVPIRNPEVLRRLNFTTPAS